MGKLRQALIKSRFGEKYMALSASLKIDHLIHGGIECFYAGLDPEHLKTAGYERVSDLSIERTLDNISFGLSTINGKDLLEGEIYFACNPRPAINGEKTREAVWQYGIYADYKLASVIGINLHFEEGLVATIANVQGHNYDALQRLRQYSELPWPVFALQVIIAHLPSDIRVLRGIPSNKHPFSDSEGFNMHSASNLYDRSFKHQRIGMSPIRDDVNRLNYYELRL